MPIKIYVRTDEIYPAYFVRDVSGPPINKLSEVMITVEKAVYNRWLRTIIDYEIIQEKIAEKLKEQKNN